MIKLKMMKAIYTLFLSLMFFGFISCNNSNIDEKKFFDLYKDILVIRTQYEDTTIANPKIRELFDLYDYSEKQFKKDFYTLGTKDEKFASKVDSLRRYVIEGKK
jgi:hypothetical protein